MFYLIRECGINNDTFPDLMLVKYGVTLPWQAKQNFLGFIPTAVIKLVATWRSSSNLYLDEW